MPGTAFARPAVSAPTRARGRRGRAAGRAAIRAPCRAGPGTIDPAMASRATRLPRDHAADPPQVHFWRPGPRRGDGRRPGRQELHQWRSRQVEVEPRSCATMSHMERVGIRELRRQASAILRRVAAGETVEVTDRGRAVAVLLRTVPSGLARLEREGLLRRAEGDLLAVAPVRLPSGSPEPSRLVSEGRAD
jgi:antitoxin (DNA-binding transcriptional repressor) of toxin-antitoxin stability system